MNVIDKAIERLRGNWHQGGYGDTRGDGPVCIYGALDCANGRPMVASNVTSALYAELRAMAHPDSLVEFNDDPSTTEEDVLLLMKKASARLDEMEASA